MVYQNTTTPLSNFLLFGYLSWVGYKDHGALASTCVALGGVGGTVNAMGMNNIVVPLISRWAYGMRYYIEGRHTSTALSF